MNKNSYSIDILYDWLQSQKWLKRIGLTCEKCHDPEWDFERDRLVDAPSFIRFIDIKYNTRAFIKVESDTLICNSVNTFGPDLKLKLYDPQLFKKLKKHLKSLKIINVPFAVMKILGALIMGLTATAIIVAFARLK